MKEFETKQRSRNAMYNQGNSYSQETKSAFTPNDSMQTIPKP